jgi:DNA modification methylase
MGSGSCGVSAVNTGRDFIGVELDLEYYTISKERIDAATPGSEAASVGTQIKK